MRTTCAMVLAMLAVLCGGCANRIGTQLQLTGNPKGSSMYEFRTVQIRDSAAGTADVVGYGFLPVFPGADEWGSGNLTNDQGGFVTMFLRIRPLTDGRCELTILGPIHPGSGEVLTAEMPQPAINMSDGVATIRVEGVPTRARNHPEMQFQLTGTIVATPVDTMEFERTLRQYDVRLAENLGKPPQSE